VRTTARIVGAVAIALTAMPTAASAGLLSSKSLWATVDACRATATHGVVGIRGSMPGSNNAAERMYMRFRLQYRTPALGARGVWHYVGSSGDSGFVFVGDGSLTSEQSGRSFQIATTSGQTYLLRGVVIFDWRLHGTPVHHAQLTTTAGHIASAGADPAGYSTADCVL
jgi:hypothetical protein